MYHSKLVLCIVDQEYNAFSGHEVLNSVTETTDSVPILGLYQTTTKPKSGRVALYGDSNCLDNSHMVKDCYWMLSAILEYTAYKTVPPVLSNQIKVNLSPAELPDRMEGNHLHRYSKVIEGHLGTPRSRPLPTCQRLVWSKPQPLNQSAPSSLSKKIKMCSLISRASFLEW
ncbi:hypothetical protein KUTeg_019399 [Tegillarca granosa]|uniref:MBTPS1 fourth domain-containing protein n=1 Tax=Tegillarca granosa TaxID=220873 RepID=A0ABQ9ECD6_TEGGR|nr:hypothetical protein KUTeg_019399 [Tegillarca granosa]